MYYWLSKARRASFLAYNKFIGSYTSNMIPRERVMWKSPNVLLKINNSGTNIRFFIIYKIGKVNDLRKKIKSLFQSMPFYQYWIKKNRTIIYNRGIIYLEYIWEFIRNFHMTLESWNHARRVKTNKFVVG